MLYWHPKRRTRDRTSTVPLTLSGMGLSQRATAWLRRDQARRAAESAAKHAAAAEAAAAFRRDYLNRDDAAAALSMSVHKFKREQLAGRGPVPSKMGDTAQSRVFWARVEISAYLADPAGYNARRAATESS